MPFIFNVVAGKKKASGGGGGGGGSTPVPMVDGGSGYAIFLDENGTAWGSGGNDRGQLGDNSTSNRSQPVSVLGSTKTFCKISAGENPFQGYRHSMGIDKNGKLWGWGSNAFFGMLGNPSFQSALTPVSVAGAAKTFCEVDCGNAFTMAIDKNGQAWGWGSGNQGRIGYGGTSNLSTPVSVHGNKTFCKITAGPSQTLAIDKNGKAWGWGNSSYGALGYGNTFTVNTPVSVWGSKTFCHISVGIEAANNYPFTIALDKNGRAWSWGYNANGQLGDNTTTSRLTPVSVAGVVKTFCKIATGDYHALAIDKNGTLWSWGSNLYGQLGDNTTTSRSTPVSVAGAAKTFCEVGAGQYTSYAIDSNNNFWAWGDNGIGQLGDGTSRTCRSTPVAVCVI